MSTWRYLELQDSGPMETLKKHLAESSTGTKRVYDDQ